MVFITEQLLKSKSEHNEGILATLEEIALHQLDIERIEAIQSFCPKLKILLLQNNLIPKIENLRRLKGLEYLNLAINNITKIENIHRLESLEKLDLTANFILDITNLRNLEENYNLVELYLTGNPCSSLPMYREYVIALLPQLKVLDGIEITRTERINASQVFEQAEKSVKSAIHKKNLKKQRLLEDSDSDDEHEYTAEQRFREHKELEERRKQAEESKNKTPTTMGKEDVSPKTPDQVPVYKKDGSILQCNNGQMPFTFEETWKNIILEVQVGRFLATDALNVDLQVDYVRIVRKNRHVLQLSLPEEVDFQKSKASRGVTGKLILTMVKKTPNHQMQEKEERLKEALKEEARSRKTELKEKEREAEQLRQSRTALLDHNFGNGPKSREDVCRSVTKTKISVAYSDTDSDEDFVDNPDVPALE